MKLFAQGDNIHHHRTMIMGSTLKKGRADPSNDTTITNHHHNLDPLNSDIIQGKYKTATMAAIEKVGHDLSSSSQSIVVEE